MGLKVADLFARLAIEPEEAGFKHAEDAIDRLKEGLHEAVLAFAGFEGAKGLYEMIQGTSEAADAALKLGQKVGLTAEQVQEFTYVAGLADVGAGEFQVSLQHLARVMQEAKGGSEEAAKAMSAAGLSFSDPAVQAGDMDAVLMRLADHFAGMPDGMAKTAAAMGLLGRSGANMIPLLNGGATGMAAMRKEARELGVVVDNETAKSFEELNDDQRRVSAAWTGIKNQVAVALLPALRDMVTGVLDWVRANRELIKSGLQALVEVLGAAMRVAAKAASLVVRGIEYIVKNKSAMHNVLGALAIMFGPGMIAALWGFAAGAAAAFLPFLVIGGAIAGLITLIEKVWDKVSSGEGIGDAILDAFVEITAWVEQKLDDLINYLKDQLAGFVDWVVRKTRFVIDALPHSADLQDTLAAVDAAAAHAQAMKAGVTVPTDITELQRMGIDTSGVKSYDLVPGNSSVPAQFHVETTVGAINVNLPPGDWNAEAVAKAVNEALHSQVRDAAAATGAQKKL